MLKNSLLRMFAASLFVVSACSGNDVVGPTTGVLPSQVAPDGDLGGEASAGDVDDSGPNVTESTESPDSVITPMPDVADFGRVIVLGEEITLADVLTLGIPVVASSATVPSVGFQGMETYDVSEIEIFDYLSLSLEELAAFRADHIITWEFLVDQVGEEPLAGLGATLHVLPTGSSGRARLRLLGEAFHREVQAEEVIAELDQAYEVGRSSMPENCAATVVAIYSGPTVAAFVEPIWDAARAVDELGCDLLPTPADAAGDRNGRAFLSLEQIGLLSAPDIIMIQTGTVEGEEEAVEEIATNPLWVQLPAVVSGHVTKLDRLGYPGVSGEIRLVSDIATALAG